MGKIYYRPKMKQFMYYIMSLFDGKMSMSLSMPDSPTNGFKTIYMGLTTNEFKKGHVYEYQESQGDALYAFYYAFEGDEWTYYTKSATPSAGDTIYDVTGTATELTVESYDDGSITVDEGSYEVTAARDSTKDVTPTIGTWTDITGSEFATKTELSGKANAATTIAGYGITDAYTKTEVNELVNNVSAYKPGGSYEFANIPSLTADHLGFLYNITDAFTTTSDFVEGVGKKIAAGNEVGIVNVGTTANPVYKYNVMGGLFDTTGFMEKSIDYVTAGKLSGSTVGGHATAEGYETVASGYASHAQNRGTIASADYQTAIGKYNVEDSQGQCLFLIGNGADANNRSNALYVTKDGYVGVKEDIWSDVNRAKASSPRNNAASLTNVVNGISVAAKDYEKGEYFRCNGILHRTVRKIKSSAYVIAEDINSDRIQDVWYYCWRSDRMHFYTESETPSQYDTLYDDLGNDLGNPYDDNAYKVWSYDSSTNTIQIKTDEGEIIEARRDTEEDNKVSTINAVKASLADEKVWTLIETRKKKNTNSASIDNLGSGVGFYVGSYGFPWYGYRLDRIQREYQELKIEVDLYTSSQEITTYAPLDHGIKKTQFTIIVPTSKLRYDSNYYSDTQLMFSNGLNLNIGNIYHYNRYECRFELSFSHHIYTDPDSGSDIYNTNFSISIPNIAVNETTNILGITASSDAVENPGIWIEARLYAR